MVKLHDGETILLTLKPTHRVAFYWLITRVIYNRFFILLLLLLCLHLFQNPGAFLHSGNALLVLLITYRDFLLPGLIILLTLVYYWFTQVAKAYDYVVTDQRCILTYGLLSINTRIIPFNQLADVNLYASFFERLLGIASVRLDSIATMMAAQRRRGGNNTTRMEGLSPLQAQEALECVSKQIAQKKS